MWTNVYCFNVANMTFTLNHVAMILSEGNNWLTLFNLHTIGICCHKTWYSCPPFLCPFYIYHIYFEPHGLVISPHSLAQLLNTTCMHARTLAPILFCWLNFWPQYRLVHIWFHQLLMTRNFCTSSFYFCLFPLNNCNFQSKLVKCSCLEWIHESIITNFISFVSSIVHSSDKECKIQNKPWSKTLILIRLWFHLLGGHENSTVSLKI